MKKLYAISLLAGLGFAFSANAQCTISSATITPGGLTVNANMVASGAAAPVYGWDWGDQTSPSTTQSATHTYTAAGTYTVCAVYVDGSNFTCYDSTCQTITVSATGISDPSVSAVNVKATPNPFSSNVQLTVTLDQPENVSMSVYDLTGKQVAVIQNGLMPAGSNMINWTPEGLSEGVYFLQVKAGDAVTTKKLVYTAQ
ncbi:MAG TPA: T9SS type A sorting domain-containing protein [Bacteroidia bacterium]|nr:T9SS type A sorting domain-containing protein [Bacteroidia bacterium]